MAHKKHVKLVKPNGGTWGRNEIAIMGAPCSEIKKLSSELIKPLSSEWTLAYVDADHNATSSDSWAALDYGAKEQLTNKISHFEIQHTAEKPYYFNDADLVLVNGNHFNAYSQIAWIHPKKSLEKKLDKLTNVGLVILEEEIRDIPDFLKDHLAGKEYSIIRSTELPAVKEYCTSILKKSIAPLNGLVLIGGKSTRMQTDKSKIIYHDGISQDDYMSNLLGEYCDDVFVSVRNDEQANGYREKAITDKFIGLGPYGGILSAFQHSPNAAWLVVAVDLPYLDKATLSQLKAKRNIHKMATCFIDPQNEFPEPLITIWEPRAYPVLLNFLSKGYSCPRKALINSDVEIIYDRALKPMTNVNTPEELSEVVESLK